MSVIDGVIAFFDQQFLTLLLGTVVLFLIMLVTWWVYHKLSKRDLFLLFKPGGAKARPSAGDRFLYMLKYFFIFPFYTFLGFLIFALCLFLLIKPIGAEAESNVLFIAIIIVSTIRVGAYVHESLAEDLAKLVPLSLLAVLLSSPSDSIGITTAQVSNFINLIPGFLKYLLFTIILEGALRVGTWIFIRLRSEPSAKQ